MASKKSPAFQFYPSNFLGSPKVRAMNAAEIGVYWLLCCIEWEESGFTIQEAEDIAASARVSVAQFSEMWPKLSRCFIERDGRYFSPRLNKERAKQREWRRKSSKGGKLSAQRRLKGGSRVVQPPPQPPPQPKGNTPSPSPTPSPVTTTATTSAPEKPARTPASWLLPSSRVWEAKYGEGSFPWGEFGRHCKPLKQHHPPAVIADHLGRYLSRTETQFVSSARFAKTFAEYAPVNAGALVDEFGCLTPEGERQTRPARVA